MNASCICNPSELLASGHLALFEPAGAPPTRFRWKKGESKAESAPFKPSETPPETVGLEVDSLLGLVVDLGVHWKHCRESGESGEQPSLDLTGEKS